MTVARRELKVKVKDMGQANAVGATSIEAVFSSCCKNLDVLEYYQPVLRGSL